MSRASWPVSRSSWPVWVSRLPPRCLRLSPLALSHSLSLSLAPPLSLHRCGFAANASRAGQVNETAMDAPDDEVRDTAGEGKGGGDEA